MSDSSASTDDGFHPGASDLVEDNILKSLHSKGQELEAICNSLGLHPSTFSKATRENLEKYAQNVMGKEVTEVSRTDIAACHARYVLKQDELYRRKSTLDGLKIVSADLLNSTTMMNSLYERAIRYLENETKKNEKHLNVGPSYSKYESCEEDHKRNERDQLLRRAALAVKNLSEKKNESPNSVTQSNDIISTQLEDKKRELEILNGRLAKLGL